MELTAYAEPTDNGIYAIVPTNITKTNTNIFFTTFSFLPLSPLLL